MGIALAMAGGEVGEHNKRTVHGNRWIDGLRVQETPSKR